MCSSHRVVSASSFLPIIGSHGMRAPQSSSLARSRRPSSHGGASPNSSPLRGSIAMVRKSSKAFARTDPSSPTSPPSIAARRGGLGMPQYAARRDLCRRRLQGWHTLTARRAPSLGAEEDMTAAGGRGGAPPPTHAPARHHRRRREDEEKGRCFTVASSCPSLRAAACELPN